jgi:hypothetical protein
LLFLSKSSVSRESILHQLHINTAQTRPVVNCTIAVFIFTLDQHSISVFRPAACPSHPS